MQIEFTSVIVGLALFGWAALVRKLDQHYYIPENRLPWIFFGGGLLVIDLALRAALWLSTLVG